MTLKLLAMLILIFANAFACNSSAFKGNKTSADAGSGSILVNDSDFLANGPNSILDSTTLSSGIDLVIALDTSGSMNDEKLALQNNLGKLLVAIQNGKLDPRIHIIARASAEDIAAAPANGFRFPADIDATKIAIVAQKIDSNDALGHLTKLMEGLYSKLYTDVNGAAMAKPLELRAGAKLEILVISDDDGKNGTDDDEIGYSNLAKDFDTSNKYNATISGIIGLPTSVGVEGVCSVDAVGQEYITLAAKTGGSILDICSSDWTLMIQRYSQDVVKRSASILLSKIPLDPSAIVVSLDGKVLPKSAWSFDANDNRVTLLPGTAYTANMVLRANYNAK